MWYYLRRLALRYFVGSVTFVSFDGLLTGKAVVHKWFRDTRHAREIRYRQLQLFGGFNTMRNLMGNWVRFHPILSTTRTIEPQKIWRRPLEKLLKRVSVALTQSTFQLMHNRSGILHRFLY